MLALSKASNQIRVYCLWLPHFHHPSIVVEVPPLRDDGSRMEQAHSVSH